ncbi:MAG: hypothetical protein MUF54_23685, partial [Polyangiaceae bacterium]|nr:hypothetical protein [Polyangiaceae bacterium]
VSHLSGCGLCIQRRRYGQLHRRWDHVLSGNVCADRGHCHVDLECHLFGVGGAQLPDELENWRHNAGSVEHFVRLESQRDLRVEHVGACSRAVRHPGGSSRVFHRNHRAEHCCI